MVDPPHHQTQAERSTSLPSAGDQCLLRQQQASWFSQLLFWEGCSLSWCFPRTSELWQGPGSSLRLTKQPGVDRRSGASQNSSVSSSVRAVRICADARDVHSSSSRALPEAGSSLCPQEDCP